MGSSGAETPTKASKSSAAQEQPPVPPATGAAVYPEWGGFQAYSPMPPHGFFPSPMASSPQAHPYVWGQHMMPPYGTPPHPYLMYPHGGIYAHPSMHPGTHPFSPYPMPPPNSNVDAPDAAPGGEELEGKSSNCKDKSSLKATKGSLGSLKMITGKNNNELGKTSGASNGTASHSVESGIEDSSDGSDANSQKDSQAKTGITHGSSEAEVTPSGSGGDHDSQNGVTRMPPQAIPNQGVTIIPMQVTGAPAGVSGPTTNLNIGMDYWGAAAPPPIVPIRGKVSNPSVVSGLAPSGIGAGRENIPSDLWLQDERELKRQRRKQSNRESARRSRLRKQAECEELGHRVEALKEENSTLISELNRFRKEYQQLLSENTSLKERLDEVPKDNATRLDMSNLHSGERGMNLDSNVQEGLADNVQSS